MKSLSLVVVFVILIVTIGIWYLFRNYSNNRLYELCIESYEYTIKNEYNGVVVDKFIDSSNHATKTVKLLVGDRFQNWGTIGTDVSGIYDYIMINDSVSKSAGSDSLYIFRVNAKTAVFKLDFNCDRYK